MFKCSEDGQLENFIYRCQFSVSDNKTINRTFIFGGMNRSETSSRFRKHRHGTVTQVYDDKFVAFGHPFFADGKSTLPVYRAVTHGIVSSLAISSKSVSAYGNPIGTITKDLHPAIVGELGPGPAMIPVKVSYHPVNSTPIEKHHLVAYGQEWALSYVAAVTMDAIRMERNAATVEGTVTLHFQGNSGENPNALALGGKPADILC